MSRTLSFRDTSKIIRDSDITDFKFVKKFKNQGKQGIVGILQHRVHKNVYCIYKTSQIINYLPKHEYNIMEGLNTVRQFCPHFCGSYKLIEMNVNKDYKKQTNLFDVDDNAKIHIDTLLMEYIPYKNLYTCITNKSISKNILFSTIKQVLLAVSVAQSCEHLTHYDLHSCNILMNPCNKDDVFLYKMGNNYTAIPTYGCCPKIIDFGFSYSKRLENDGIYSSLAHTEVGFLTNQFDMISDCKLFLVTVSDELRTARNDDEYNIFRRVVRNIFQPLNIDWENGWDLYSQAGASNFITEELVDVTTKSSLFNEYNEYCIDLIQSLITLPLKKRKTSNIVDAYKLMTTEFSKIEKQFDSSITKMYVLKKIIEIARGIRPFYEDKAQRNNSILLFKRRFNEFLTSTFRFCLPVSLHYEKLLCGMFVFSNASEGILYSIIKVKEKEHNDSYEQMRLKTPLQIYSAIETNIPDTYRYNKNTRVYILIATKRKILY